MSIGVGQGTGFSGKSPGGGAGGAGGCGRLIPPAQRGLFRSPWVVDKAPQTPQKWSPGMSGVTVGHSMESFIPSS